MSQGVQVAPRSCKRQGDGFPLEASRRNAALLKPSKTLISALQNCNIVPLCCFQPLSLQQFVIILPRAESCLLQIRMLKSKTSSVTVFGDAIFRK